MNFSGEFLSPSSAISSAEYRHHHGKDAPTKYKRRPQTEASKASSNGSWFGTSWFGGGSSAKNPIAAPFSVGTELQRRYKITHEWKARGAYEYRTATNVDVKVNSSTFTPSDHIESKVLVRLCYNSDRFKRELRSLAALHSQPSIPAIRASFAASLCDVKPACSFLVMEPAIYTAENFWDQYKEAPAGFLLGILKGLMRDITESLVACQAANIVHNSIRPFTIMYFPDYSVPTNEHAATSEKPSELGPGRWKLVGFDLSCTIGEFFVPKYIDFAGAEVVRGILASRPVRAHPSIDIFAMGRCVQFFLYAHQDSDYSIAYYPGLWKSREKQAREGTIGRQDAYNASRMERMKFLVEGKSLLYEPERVKVPGSGGGEWRELLRVMLQREPVARITCKKLLAMLMYSGEDDQTTSTTINANGVGEKEEESAGGGFDPKSLAEKQVVAGQFTIVAPVGSSGSANAGSVWRARDIDSDLDLILKFHHGLDPFMREAEALKLVRHRNVIQMLDAFEQDEDSEFYPFALTVLESGVMSLREYARYQLPLRLTQLKLILEDICNGLKACHDMGIVHADLKLSNVMMFRIEGAVREEGERWKLIDFDSSCAEGDTVTRGTIEYIAPELANALLKGKDLAARPSLDAFALGRIIKWISVVRKPGILEDDVDIFWPGISSMLSKTEDETDMGGEQRMNFSSEEKLTWLVSVDTVPVEPDWIPHTPTRNLVKQLLEKDPKTRIGVDKVLSGSYLAMDLDTQSFTKR